MLGQQRVQFAINSAERARPFLYQGRADLQSLGAAQVSDVSIPSAIDSTHRHDVEKTFALVVHRMRVRESADLALDRPAGEVDFEILGQIILANRYRNLRGLEEIGQSSRRKR